jgi:hypothetical protein
VTGNQTAIEHICLGDWIHVYDDLGYPVWSRVAARRQFVQGDGRTRTHLAALDHGTGETTAIRLFDGETVECITAAQWAGLA